jgi:galactokinase
VAVTPRPDNEIHLTSLDFNDRFITTTENENTTQCSWANYILGVVDQFRIKNVALKGFDLAVYGDIPMGGGLSSSAALECATALALNKYYQTNFEKIELVKMAQHAEHKFTGVKCGIMDQFASMFGKDQHAIKLDCRSLEYEYVPFDVKGISIILFDSNVKHSLASTEYNLRRQECLSGVGMISGNITSVKSLRDVSLSMLDEYVLPKSQLIYNRCKYVVEENARLLAACKDLEKNDLISFGKKMFETHQGLSELYGVSCKELDFLVDFVKNEPSVLGARMMGGGFGGCTINLIKSEDVDMITTKISKAYSQELSRQLGVHIVKIEEGGSLI